MKHHHYLIFYIIVIDIVQAFLTSFFLIRLNFNSSSFKRDFWSTMSWALLIPPVPLVVIVAELIKNVKNGENVFAFSRDYKIRKLRIKEEKIQNKRGIKFSIMRFFLKYYT